MSFGQEICDTLSDIDLQYSRSLRGWFFYEPERAIPIAEVVTGKNGWGFYCEESNGEWEWFDTLEEAQDRCTEWADGVAETIIMNKEKEAWGVS